MLCVFFLFALLGASMFEYDLRNNDLYKTYYKTEYNSFNNTYSVATGENF